MGSPNEHEWGLGHHGTLQGAQQKDERAQQDKQALGFDLIIGFVVFLTTMNGIHAEQQEAYMSNVEYEWLWHSNDLRDTPHYRVYVYIY